MPSTFELTSCPQQSCGSNPHAFLLPIPHLSKIQLCPAWAPADLAGALPRPSCTENAVPEHRSLQILPSFVPQSLVPICASSPSPGVTSPGRGHRAGAKSTALQNPKLYTSHPAASYFSSSWCNSFLFMHLMGKGCLVVKRQGLGETFLFHNVPPLMWPSGIYFPGPESK